MTATLAELLTELEDSPVGTDFLTLEQLLVRAGYVSKEVAGNTRRFSPPAGGPKIYLRADLQHVNSDIVKYVVHMIRLYALPREGRSV